MNQSDNSELFKKLEAITKEGIRKTSFLKSFRGALFEKETAYQHDFKLIIPKLQDCLENVFDRMLRCYIRPKQKDEWMFDDEIEKSIRSESSPEKVRDHLIFNFGFAEKKALIYRLFKPPKHTKRIIDKLNALRNAIAHRYDENDKRFVYNGKNILHDHGTLIKFCNDCVVAVNDILDIDTNLLDTIDRAEKKLG